jgi:hypothetical protein
MRSAGIPGEGVDDAGKESIQALQIRRNDHAADETRSNNYGSGFLHRMQ